MALIGLESSNFLTCLPSTISKNKIFPSKPQEHNNNRLTGEKAIPVHGD